MKLIQDAMLFVDVVQAGSFTRAAQVMNSSKSQISRRISELEQRLNAALLIRLQRGLQLTEAGERFYQSCLSIQQDFESATSNLQDQQQEVSGNLMISAPMSIGSAIIGPLLAKFMRSYPKLTIELDLSDSVKSVAESGIDIALRAARQLPDSNLKAQSILSYGYVVCATPDYLKHHGTPTAPQDLTNHSVVSCVTTGESQSRDKWDFVYEGKEISVDVKSIARVTHMQVQKAIALEDQAIIRVPEYWVKDEIESGELQPLLEPYNLIKSNLFAVYKPLAVIPEKINVLIKYLKENLS